MCLCVFQINRIDFLQKTLRSHSGTLFITLGARLVNDDIPTCRKMVADALSCMINRLDKADRLPLFDIVVLWLKDNKVSPYFYALLFDKIHRLPTCNRVFLYFSHISACHKKGLKIDFDLKLETKARMMGFR